MSSAGEPLGAVSSHAIVGQRDGARAVTRRDALSARLVRAPLAGLVLLAGVVPAHAQESAYVPPPFPAEWERRPPVEVGMDPDLLQAAVDHALTIETEVWPEGHGIEEALAEHYLAGEPYNEIVGPMKERGAMNGVILRGGYIVAEWGPTDRVDMVFSVSKAFIPAVGGLAFDRGLIPDVHAPVQPRAPDRFDTPHNRRITWHHLFNQTSDWQGTLWGKPDWADRYEGEQRPRHEPGTNFRYNDVRVNVAALALLHVWRRPLPQVLREHLMDPIGASNTWRWNGYENSWVLIDGQWMQSVAGGGHWGGGMWISTRDLARFGLLYLRRGGWASRRVLSEQWVARSTAPGDVNPGYGYMQWWLNTGRRALPSAPETAFYASGGSSNRLYVDPENDLVIVVRWIDGGRFDEIVERVLASIVD